MPVVTHLSLNFAVEEFVCGFRLQMPGRAHWRCGVSAGARDGNRFKDRRGAPVHQKILRLKLAKLAAAVLLSITNLSR
jgi:hypothetical protein